jgi:hypothetical protein
MDRDVRIEDRDGAVDAEKFLDVGEDASGNVGRLLSGV